MNDNRRIGLWDAYQRMGNPLVVQDEETGEWVDLTVASLVKIIKDEFEKQGV